LAACREGVRPGAARAEAGASEQRLEEVAEIARAGARACAAAEMEVLLPVGRRPELLAGAPILPERVVRGALLGIAQDLVGFAQLLEALFGVRLLADVRMVFASETAVRALDLVLRRVPVDAHDLVVVLVFHACASPSIGGRSPAIRPLRSRLGTLGVRRAGIKPIRTRFSKGCDTMP